MSSGAALPAARGNKADRQERRQLDLTGRIQGVGFRPFVYRLAHQLQLQGQVTNTRDGVSIDIQGPQVNLDQFERRLLSSLPPLARVDTVSVTIVPLQSKSGFAITPSRLRGDGGSQILPDAAICDDCRRDILDPGNRRYQYPFTNCTNCGPRFSIVTGLPYDRERTSMRPFAMCPACREEYENPGDRRFHAQPNACPTCGPQLALWNSRGTRLAGRHDALVQAAEAVRCGRVVALKGLGGFQLLCDARNDRAVTLLRQRKQRPHKPFAVMYPSLERLQQHCVLSTIETAWLQSPAAPIVLVPRRTDGTDADRPCHATAPDNTTLGVMLPYTPLHVLLIQELGFPIIATSGNRGGEPICIDEREAVRSLGDIADCFLVHDRPIVRRVDDSVIRIVEAQPVIMRLARGLAPVMLESNQPIASIVATGGHQKSAFAFTVNSRIMVSQHVGDLDTAATRDALTDSIRDLTSLYNTQPKIIACDDHPDYASSCLARTMTERPATVQHHLAHILGCMAEYQIDGPVLGVAWDGSGRGTDNTIWGSEFFEVQPDAVRRVAHLRPFPLPGGEAAVLEPRRVALALLFAHYGNEIDAFMPVAVRRAFSDSERTVLLRMLSRKTNCPMTTSAGRLFDGFSSLLDLCHRTSFEGQAAIRLEQTCDDDDRGHPPYSFDIDGGDVLVLDWRPMLAEVLADLARLPASTIAQRIHMTFAEMICRVAAHRRIETIILSGGCFQNARLLAETVERLKTAGMKPLWPHQIPINDGGLAVGQLVAAARRSDWRC